MKKTLLCFLLMLFLLLLASCSQDKEPVHDPASALIGEDGSCPYVLVRPDDAAQSIVSKVVDLRAVLNDATGVTFDLTTDFVKAGSSDFKEIDTEILIGSTNREISSALPDLRSGDWAILRRGTKIAVIGSDKPDEALTFFRDNYISCRKLNL